MYLYVCALFIPEFLKCVFRSSKFIIYSVLSCSRSNTGVFVFDGPLALLSNSYTERQ